MQRMKIRQKGNSGKMVHMGIDVVARSGTDKLTSPQAMLQQSQSDHIQDKIFEENPLQIESSSSMQQSSSLDGQKQPNSGNIQQKQQLKMQKLTRSYLNDYYQGLLRPIGIKFIIYSVGFLLLFCVLKILWVREEIIERKQKEECYLRNIMIEKATDVKMEYQHAFTFLDEVKELLQYQRYDQQVQQGINKTCESYESYGGRYNCVKFTVIDNTTLYNATGSNTSYSLEQQYFLESIDTNYNLLTLQIGSLIAHIPVTNVFILNLGNVTEGNVGAVGFSLKNIVEKQLDGFTLQEGRQEYINWGTDQSNKLQPSHINLFVNYIRTLTSSSNTSNTTSSQQLFTSYINLPLSSHHKYQLYQMFISPSLNVSNNTSNNVNDYSLKFNLYCLNLQTSHLSTNFNSKLCVSIRQSQNYNVSSTQSSSSSSSLASNILYTNNKFTKILLTNQKIISIFQQYQPILKLYTLLSQFIIKQVDTIYPQYALNKQAIVKCLQFHEEFYQLYSSQTQNLEILRCYSTTYMHALVTKYLFSWARMLPLTFSYHNLLPVSMVNDTEYLQIQLFYLSNLTYYSDVHNISRKGIDIIELTIKIYFFVLTLALLSFQQSTNIIQNLLIDSLIQIKRLSKIVLTIDDVKKSQNQFKKILKQLQQIYTIPSTPILGSIIGYLQKFLWIKKLYHYNKKFPQHKTKKNRLLFEGLNVFKYLNNGQFPGYKQNQSRKQLRSRKQTNINRIKSTRFESEQNSEISEMIIRANYIRHPGALIYIYQEMIYLQKQKINKFRNIQMLTKRKTEQVKSSQMNILQEIDEHRLSESRYGYNTNNNNESRFNFKEGGRYSREGENQSIFGEEVPQISIMDSKPRQNRGVRFSNQIQLKGFNTNNSQKKSKFRQHILSNSSIGKKGSLKSVKSIESEMKKKVEESQKQQRSEESSGVMSSSKKMKRETTIKKILRGDESVHEGLKTMKFDESSNIYDKESMMNKSSVACESVQGEVSIDQFYYTHKQALQQSLQSYEKMMHYYEQVVDIQERLLQKQLMCNKLSYQEQQLRANHIYGIQLKRLKVSQQYLQLLIQEHMNQKLEIDFQELGVTVSYQHLEYYEKNYQIQSRLIEQAILYKMKVDIALGKSFSYKRLQQILDSDHQTNIALQNDVDSQPPQNVALQATLLYAQQLHKLQPFLDYEVINTVYNSLLLYQTSTTYKQHSLQLIIDTLLPNPKTFSSEIDELKSIKKYYNTKHKKFYFIADMSESFDIFTPILTKIYQLMAKMDLMEVYNLAMNENTEDMQLVREIIKPQTSQAFLSLFQQLTLESSKSKQKNSSKIIHKKYVIQKDFNQILGTFLLKPKDQIEKDENEFSSFLVVILGGDQLSNHSSMMTDDADSSSNQRQLNQLLHSEINRKISQNYYHLINIGTHLNNFLTKQGKLKKHIKNSPDLLQIDLIKKNLPQHYTQLEKFLQ